VPFIVRLPGKVPAGRRSDALQSLVDLAPTFLKAAAIAVPSAMTGLDQSAVWFGESPAARDHVVVENRHEPTTIHVKPYVNARHKLTVYYGRNYGELFDLAEDPGELRNRWADPDYRALRSELVMALLQAEMGKEPLPMPRIAGA
jgi:uncharacterized sulfatase